MLLLITSARFAIMIKRRGIISQNTFDGKILQFVSSQSSTVKNV